MALVQRKVMPLAGVVLGLGMILVGALADMADTQPPRGPAAEVALIQRSYQVYARFVGRLFTLPQVCWSGNTVNDFQRKQCDEFWSELALRGAVAAIPFGVALLVLLMGREQITTFYRRSRKRVDAGQADAGGVVTDPAQAAGDRFSWFFGLRVITIQLADKTQLRVYLPENAPIPQPGQKLAAFKVGKLLGAPRHIGVIYAPHLAIVRGA